MANPAPRRSPHRAPSALQAEDPAARPGLSRCARLALRSPDERIASVRKGFPARIVVELAGLMGWTQEHAIGALKLTRSTVIRKIRDDAPLDTADSERLLAVLDMIEQARQMVARSGNAAGFDPGRWLADWLDSPNPALDGRLPADYLDTHEGTLVVRRLLAQMESSAYA